MGQSLTSLDCLNLFKCIAIGNITITPIKACSANSTCSIDQNNNPICVCKAGYFGDGYSCTTSTNITKID